MTSDMVRAPWTALQVAALNRRQADDRYHPYTCGNDHCRGVLIAEPDGWRCPRCSYRQDWAHEDDAVHRGGLGRLKSAEPETEVQQLKHILRRLVMYMQSMPDAGLVADDPRRDWYIESYALRQEALRALGDET